MPTQFEAIENANVNGIRDENDEIPLPIFGLINTASCDSEATCSDWVDGRQFWTTLSLYNSSISAHISSDILTLQAPITNNTFN